MANRTYNHLRKQNKDIGLIQAGWNEVKKHPISTLTATAIGTEAAMGIPDYLRRFYEFGEELYDKAKYPTLRAYQIGANRFLENKMKAGNAIKHWWNGTEPDWREKADQWMLEKKHRAGEALFPVVEAGNKFMDNWGNDLVQKVVNLPDTLAARRYDKRVGNFEDDRALEALKKLHREQEKIEHIKNLKNGLYSGEQSDFDDYLTATGEDLTAAKNRAHELGIGMWNYLKRGGRYLKDNASAMWDNPWIKYGTLGLLGAGLGYGAYRLMKGGHPVKEAKQKVNLAGNAGKNIVKGEINDYKNMAKGVGTIAKGVGKIGKKATGNIKGWITTKTGQHVPVYK